MANTITIETELKNKIKILATLKNKTIKDIVIEALEDILNKYGNR